MITSDFPEADWRKLRDIAKVALERLSKRILDEAAAVATGADAPSEGYHERYLALTKLLRDRRDEMAAAFDGLRRSTALLQLASMRRLALFADEEFMRFSQQTRDQVQAFLGFSEKYRQR